MLSIIDVKDFIEVDRETVIAVQYATGMPREEAHFLARQLLSDETGIVVIHHMFQDLIASGGQSTNHPEVIDVIEFRNGYNYFARKYPIPHRLENRL